MSKNIEWGNGGLRATIKFPESSPQQPIATMRGKISDQAELLLGRRQSAYCISVELILPSGSPRELEALRSRIIAMYSTAMNEIRAMQASSV